jgi:hypothetical protein
VSPTPKRWFLAVTLAEPRTAGDKEGHDFHGNQYVYHGTSEENLASIKEHGLRPWRDAKDEYGSPLNFHHIESSSRDYSKFDANDRPQKGVLFRVKKSDLPKDIVHDPLTNRSWTSTIVSPNVIEIERDGKWKPLRTAGDKEGHDFHGNQWDGKSLPPPSLFYHGSVTTAIESVRKNGILSGDDVWSLQNEAPFLPQGGQTGPDHKVYLTENIDVAKKYARRDWAWHGPNAKNVPVIFEINIPPEHAHELVPEVYQGSTKTNSNEYQRAATFPTRIPPEWIGRAFVYEPPEKYPKSSTLGTWNELKTAVGKPLRFYTVIFVKPDEPKTLGDKEGHEFHGNQFTLYHGTRDSSVASILKEGLKPGSIGLTWATESREHAQQFANNLEYPAKVPGTVLAIHAPRSAFIFEKPLTKHSPKIPVGERVARFIMPVPPEWVKTLGEHEGHEFHGNQWNTLLHNVTVRPLSENLDRDSGSGEGTGVVLSLPADKGSIILMTSYTPAGWDNKQAASSSNLTPLPSGYADVFNVSVNTERQGDGFKLYDAALQHLQSSGLQGIASWPPMRSDEARRFWTSLESHGATITHQNGWDLLTKMSPVMKTAGEHEGHEFHGNQYSDAELLTGYATTGGTYRVVNEGLRAGKDMSTHPTVGALDRAFASHAEAAPKILYRGVGGYVPGVEFDRDTGESSGLNLTIGQTFQDLGFVSTADDKTSAVKFATHGEGKLSEEGQGIIFKITTAGAKSLNMGSHSNYGEREHLLNRGTKFKITSIHDGVPGKRLATISMKVVS